ncbi:hypothetical protein [Nocardia higoensis]|uniref:hypothetical protein n=1 Tax=Nocardia higoensis TaxID=228599 RepID=UPI0012F6B6DF|nr:hypothetical protein [Nocardia higoensis]
MTTDPIDGGNASTAGIINSQPIRVNRLVARMAGERAKLAAREDVCVRSTVMVPTTGMNPADEKVTPEYEPVAREVEVPPAHNAGTLWTQSSRPQPGQLMLMFTLGSTSQSRSCGVLVVLVRAENSARYPTPSPTRCRAGFGTWSGFE